MKTSSHPRPLQLQKYKTPAQIPMADLHHHVHAGANPFNSVLAFHQPDSYHQPPLPRVHSWQHLTPIEVHTNSQGPYSCLRAQIQPYLLSLAYTTELNSN